ncbi:ABC transporter substrate-binding protein [Paenibacillus radicis (ex Gao et al. 2016)]|uniref:Peptide ABC transporter substrate-binding protein n=1 Tax=Paenibacillus radicis (ex Gao et al. 2016) TaxID=1737354 RepID=A0A917HQK5_9BACL|nr:ABC transporter substrate-binding protein [Paenibacillus radicis (ex Gao et al. 2016)]GGG87079.1 peptide ABC transporter substrate-binding protein [Paenibacillus radicis (ex Gao et al. 2016)]
MKNKGKFAAILLSLTIMISGCSLTTKKDVSESPQPTEGTKVVDSNPVDIEVLGMSANEADLNIIRDQLGKNGFNVKLNIQADYSSYKAQQDAGNFDVSLSSWTTVTGNPDYAVRSLFKTGGDYSILSDSEIDALIDQAASQTPEEFAATYKDFEQKLVFDKAYIVPLYSSLKAQALNKDVLNPASVRLSKSRSLPWEELDFNDVSKRNKDALVLQSTMPTLTSLDPIKGNDGSINIINTNQYVRLVNLTDDDHITSVGSLSRNHAIAEGNSDYYFILRDDINFAQIKDKLAVDTGERVGADDVIFSLDRAKNKNSVPDHRTFTLHEHIKSAEVVTDLAALDAVKVSGGDSTVKAALEKGLDSKISELVSDKTQANNASGKYQVVKLTTTTPFPQVLNYLAHQSAGIVSKKQVEKINTYDVAKFDPNKDIPYGDQNTVTEGSAYNNTLYTSGPYILSYKNDYDAIFYKNPAYMKGTEHEPKINNIKIRFIKDADSSLSALRSGEIHLYYGVSETKFDIVKGDAKLSLQTLPSNAVSYLLFNTKNRPVAESADLRKAVLYSLNQDDFITYYGGNKFKATSTLSPMVNTGLELKADAAKAKEFLNAYKASK